MRRGPAGPSASPLVRQKINLRLRVPCGLFDDQDALFRTESSRLADLIGYFLVRQEEFSLAGQWIEDKNIRAHFATGRATAASVAVNQQGAHCNRTGTAQQPQPENASLVKFLSGSIGYSPVKQARQK